ncbi:ecdysteroid 22-kinase family protein [Methylicorpusculum oleiharenae]|uniref:ecdysteroid 22-kinase family protein n=1 Tax=Methylicorpusculum oleiharenae TaxID=1338687 RepID=UPI001E2A2C0F|nr:ecdysteroid 22-kinase family protein [Methylicorpusculum oleiharenae]MCD2449996.1 ecdysteroid 22-kinase family protein [Methylicorpusculum oleiharenae]
MSFFSLYPCPLIPLIMNHHFQDIILKATATNALFEIEVIQSLWSGYGKIVRYGLKGGMVPSVVVKHVEASTQGRHPRGWNSDLSHQRKMRSYQVETAWYGQWSRHCDSTCRVPACLAFEAHGDEVLIVLEDLNASGFPERRSSVTANELANCLVWLANFHAVFMNENPQGLWPTGTYWHLETRPDELQALKDTALKTAAGAIDRKLRNSPFQTFVHGDAKLANFCFSRDGKSVAAVDFQYVGGGCGIKDVAYFIGSCLNEDECQRKEAQLLDLYFIALKTALKSRQKRVDSDAVEQNWRELYPVAWTDFHRFLKGWSPGHWKVNCYSERLAREVIAHVQLAEQESA